MIIIADKISKLELTKLTELYSDVIEKDRKRNYGRLSEYEGRLQAELDYYQYLRDVFFSETGGEFFVLEKDGRYITGVCIEPYKDGLLLNSLVTMPDARRKGFAEKLLNFALSRFSGLPVYVHIHIQNVSSRRLHEKVGFTLLYDYAYMLDGSIRSDYITYIKKG